MTNDIIQSDTDVDDDFSFLQPLDLITKDAYELQRIVKEKKENLQKDKSETNEKDNETKQKSEMENAREREDKEKKAVDQEENHDKEMTLKEPEEDKEKTDVDHHGAVKSEQVEHEENNGDHGGNLSLPFSFSSTCYVNFLSSINVGFSSVSTLKSCEYVKSGPEPMEISTTPTSMPCELPISDVKILEGHTSEVCRQPCMPYFVLIFCSFSYG